MEEKSDLSELDRDDGQKMAISSNTVFTQEKTHYKERERESMKCSQYQTSSK